MARVQGEVRRLWPLLLLAQSSQAAAFSCCVWLHASMGKAYGWRLGPWRGAAAAAGLFVVLRACHCRGSGIAGPVLGRHETGCSTDRCLVLPPALPLSQALPLSLALVLPLSHALALALPLPLALTHALALPLAT